MLEYPIGATVEHHKEQWRVVRIIGSSVTLFEDDTQAYLQTESYVELKGADGSIDFVSLTMERTPYEGPTSVVKGLEPINFGGIT